VRALYTKVKEGSDQEIILEEGKKRWREITIAGVKTATVFFNDIPIVVNFPKICCGIGP